MHYKIEIYETISGKEPYMDFLRSLDGYDAARLSIRVDRLQVGNFSNCEPIGDGAHEIKMDFGPGYRIYFVTISVQKILVLYAGTKRTQSKDIKKAKEFLIDYKKRGKHAKK